MKASEVARQLIRHFEGLRLRAYKCTSNKNTIGWGHTRNVTMGMIITTEEAERLLEEDIRRFEQFLEGCLGDLEAITQGQIDALVSWVFNVGGAQAQTSTLIKLMKKGDTQGAADELLKWNKGTIEIAGVLVKRPVSGLTRRRAAERQLFLTGKLKLPK